MNDTNNNVVILSGARSSRRTCCCFCALLLLALTSPTLVRAQFQKPTDEELKMTADPKAPGAAAVYLNVEEVTNDPIHYQTFYARIKVLTEKGKELATVVVPPYLRSEFMITDIKGRTIHSDGTVIPLTGKPEDLLVSKGKTSEGDQTQVNRMVFTLPSVEIGSILEYTYMIQNVENVSLARHWLSSVPHWEIQRPYFVHKAHYQYIPFKAFMPGIQNMTRTYLLDKHENPANTLFWWARLPDGVVVKHDSTGHYSVDVTDIPPSPDVECMPPIDSIRYKVLFYYSNSSIQADFWVSESNYWSKDVDRFTEPTNPIKQAVATLITSTDSDLDKAKKLYTAVQALDNTSFSRKKTESELKQLKLMPAKRAEDTWSQKSGSSQDITLLYLAMLHAAGFTAYDMKVADRQERIFDPSYLNFDQLDDDLIVAIIAGKEIFLDPGEKMCPFQIVHWKHSGATGIRQGTDGRSFLTTPPQAYTDNKIVRTGEIALDAYSTITGGALRIGMSGQEALRWRQIALSNDLDEVKKQFDRSLESIIPVGVVAHVDQFLGLYNPDVNLIAIVNVHGSVGAATSKRLLLPAFFFETHGKQPFVAQEKRTQPVDMHYGDLVTDQVTYHLPDGFTVEGAPQDNKITWPQHAILTIKSVSAPGQITIARQLSRAFTFAKPEEYQDLRGFYQKVATADQQQLVLTRSSANKGNQP